MTEQRNYQRLGWEQFEDLCIALWFDEGYTAIRPYGRRNEAGRDAVFYDPGTDDLIIFQFKRWASDYSPPKVLNMIREAAEKVQNFDPSRFVLNSPLPPNPRVNDGIDPISNELGFTVEYWDRTWIDLRLNNRRQDLRRQYFGPTIEHHSIESLLSSSADQVSRALSGFSDKYDPEIYISREPELMYESFVDSNKTCFIIVDRSGRGKTNLLCKLAETHIERGDPAIIIDARNMQGDSHVLERELATELGYAPGEYPRALNDLKQLLLQEQKELYVLIDGVSEARGIGGISRALRDLVLEGKERALKVFVTCRREAWNAIEYWLPKHELFTTRPLTGSREADRGAYFLMLGDFTKAELELAMPLYSARFNVSFIPMGDASSQLRHPLLLRVFCAVNEGQTIGTIPSVPIYETFDTFLDQKLQAIVALSGGNLHEADAWAVLLTLSRMVWENRLGANIDRHDLIHGLIDRLSAENAENLITALVSEGLLKATEDILSGRKFVSVVFDELGDFLLLRYFISLLPSDIRTELNLETDAESLLPTLRVDPNKRRVSKFIELIGMGLTSLDDRRAFLREAAEIDFAALCRTLVRIPPTGTFFHCEEPRISEFAEELAGWYRDLVDRFFPEVKSRVDPWIHLVNHPGQYPELAIDLQFSPHCKELSYRYFCAALGEETTLIEGVDTYPIVQMKFMTEDKEVAIHDPDGGISLSVLRQEGTGGRTQRIINFSVAPPYPGATLDVPEGIATFDLRGELTHMIDQDMVPREPLILVGERARAIASEIPGLDKVEGLTVAELREREEEILGQWSAGDYDFVMNEARINRLYWLLGQLNGVIPPSVLPEPDRSPTPESGDGYTDSRLEDYLLELFSNAAGAYRAIVRDNFKEIEDFLNIQAQYPFTLMAITDRRFVRCLIVPEGKAANGQVRANVIDEAELDLGDPSVSLIVDDLRFDEYVLARIDELERGFSAISPFDRAIPIRELFSPTPINDIVKSWLKADLRSAMAV